VTRRRHRLDLLPLLDVFMVVLFVFATMREHELDASVGREQELAEELASTRSQLVAAEQRAERASTRGDEEEEEARRTEQWREKAEQAREALQALREQTEAAAPGEDVARRHEVYRRLLDHFTVYEIEIAGIETSGAIANRCCYRVDVQQGWRPCGEVPAVATDREAWLDAGGGGLLDVLRKTKGGNALTIVRQDEIATHRIASKVGELLRRHFDRHEIYAGTTSPTAIECPQ
jgi:hypothetical protein